MFLVMLSLQIYSVIFSFFLKIDSYTNTVKMHDLSPREFFSDLKRVCLFCLYGMVETLNINELALRVEQNLCFDSIFIRRRYSDN